MSMNIKDFCSHFPSYLRWSQNTTHYSDQTIGWTIEESQFNFQHRQEIFRSSITYPPAAQSIQFCWKVATGSFLGWGGVGKKSNQGIQFHPVPQLRMNGTVLPFSHTSQHAQEQFYLHFCIMKCYGVHLVLFLLILKMLMVLHLCFTFAISKCPIRWYWKANGMKQFSSILTACFLYFH